MTIISRKKNPSTDLIANSKTRNIRPDTHTPSQRKRIITLIRRITRPRNNTRITTQRPTSKTPRLKTTITRKHKSTNRNRRRPLNIRPILTIHLNPVNKNMPRITTTRRTTIKNNCHRATRFIYIILSNRIRKLLPLSSTKPTKRTHINTSTISPKQSHLKINRRMTIISRKKNPSTDLIANSKTRNIRPDTHTPSQRKRIITLIRRITRPRNNTRITTQRPTSKTPRLKTTIIRRRSCIG
jgi:hypothetical protein